MRGVWYDLYVMLDIFSRYVVGWRIEETENGELAADFIDDVIRTYGKPKAVHADRGTSMTSKNVAQLLVDLDVARSHSRPHVSDDNPYSEAAFKTLKYCPAFPGHFDDIDHARAFCKEFFDYNNEHYHSGLGLHTPASVNFGTRHGDPRRTSQSPDHRLHPHPRAVQPPARTPETTDPRVDQPTRRTHPTTEQLTTQLSKKS
jgi:putative transposase